MRNLLIPAILLAALTVRAADHRVCVYRGSILGLDQPAAASQPTRVSLRGWLVVDWTATAATLGNGWETLDRVTLVAVAPDGTVTRTDYTADPAAARPPFALVPQPDDARGLLATGHAETGWEALMLEGSVFRFTAGDAPWLVPLRLSGRYLAYSTAEGSVAAANTRYSFSLDRARTLLTAGLDDGPTAFDTAVANAEAAAQRGL